MPPKDPAKEPGPQKSLEEVVEEVGLYPREAFEFIQQGLSYTVQKLHGELKDPSASRHVSGRDLSEGLRQFALLQWGMLAGTVLRRWNIHRTDDFGRIVFAMVESGWMSKTDQDTIDDFRNIFDFRTAFEEGYRIECKS
jgi:uncharacterized repeat protein (TIGR04138 family)